MGVDVRLEYAGVGFRIGEDTNPGAAAVNKHHEREIFAPESAAQEAAEGRLPMPGTELKVPSETRTAAKSKRTKASAVRPKQKSP